MSIPGGLSTPIAGAPHRTPLLGVSVFIVLALGITGLSWHIVAATGYEAGDFAANSVLIQSAKHLRLTLGNYSRIGFNHPGPAIIYVLAIGELFFYDILGWTTPIGGQIVAACIYNAAWIALCACLLNRMGFTAAQSVLVVSISAAIIALREPHAFENIWFPYLYVMPFMAFTVALAAVAYGDRPAWIALATSTGFVIHGHVSFVGICGIGLVFIAAYELRRSWRRGLAWPVLGGFVFAIFLVPLGIRELRHHPGPIEEYAAFAGLTTAHGFVESLQFMAHRVGSSNFEIVLTGIFLLVLITQFNKKNARCILFAFVAVTLGTAFYVIKGVDDLSFDYVLIYYGAVPALIIAVTVVGAITISDARLSLVTCVATLILSVALYRDTGMPDYNRPDIVTLDHDMMRLETPFALDLSNASDYSKIWSAIAGVEIKRLRADAPMMFCINEGWHILFTEAMRCRADDNRPKIVVDVERPAENGNISILRSSGLEFFRLDRE